MRSVLQLFSFNQIDIRFVTTVQCSIIRPINVSVWLTLTYLYDMKIFSGDLRAAQPEVQVLHVSSGEYEGSLSGKNYANEQG